MSKIKERKCPNCKEFFPPDYRNVDKQVYCNKPDCRKASKKASQQRWLRKPKNRNYFRGPDNVKHVQKWRKANPGYSRRKKDTLQDHCQENIDKNQQVKVDSVSEKPEFATEKPEIQQALQDYCVMQPPVLIGIIATITDSALQDHIACSINRMHQLGLDILSGSILNEEGQNYRKVSNGPERQPP